MVLAEQEKKLFIKEGASLPSKEYNLEKGIKYGLIALIELASNYYCGGCKLTYISKTHNVPLFVLMPVIYRIKEAGLIGCRVDDCDWLFLKKEPHGTWIYDIVATLKNLFDEKK